MDLIRREIRKKWKPRKKDSHKGDFGRVFILAGSEGLTGAAFLTSLGCLKTGAGLISLGVPRKIYSILARKSREVMVRPFVSNRAGALSVKAYSQIAAFAKTQSVLALGPGLSQNKETQKLICRLIEKIKLPMVIDADGLNALAQKKTKFPLKNRPIILTPHPGEFCRLFGGHLSSQLRVRKKRVLAAAKKAQCIIVLKGHQTLVASPGGDLYLNRTGNPGMASGGTGDVLTGMIAALLGQGISAWDAARFGVYLHGLAGDLALKKQGEISLTASDLIEEISQAIRKVGTTYQNSEF